MYSLFAKRKQKTKLRLQIKTTGCKQVQPPAIIHTARDGQAATFATMSFTRKRWTSTLATANTQQVQHLSRILTVTSLRYALTATTSKWRIGTRSAPIAISSTMSLGFPSTSESLIDKSNSLDRLKRQALRLCNLMYQTHSSSNMSSYSLKQGSQNAQYQSNQIYKSPSQNKRTSSDNHRQQVNQSKLSSLRILQKHILYVIGISPSIAKDETLRKYEYFGQYGKINQITINKDNAYKSENSGICYSVYICYSTPFEASIAILAVDQQVFDNRLIRASFGRTKYCKFFLKETQCLNKECPYQHQYCNDNEVLTQDDMQKKALYQQCFQIAIEISKIAQITEGDFKAQIRQYRDQLYPNQYTKTVMPPAETILQNKSLFKIISSIQNKQVAQNAVHSSRRVTNKDPSTTSLSNLQTLQKCSSTQVPSQQEEIKIQRSSGQLQTHHSLTATGPKEIYVRKDANPHNQEEQKKQVERNSNLEQLQSHLTIKQEDLSQKVKRNNSSDERRKPKNTQSDNKCRVQNYEQQLANSLRKHLAPQQQETTKTSQEVASTNQSISIFNEKKTSRFLSLKDGNEEQEEGDQSLLLSRRSSVAQTLHQKKGSNQSLIIENVLKFLNDDTDVVPVKREPLIAYRYNPPSEVQNVATSTYSHLGGNEEEQWNNTIFSQQEQRAYQQTYGMVEDKSYYSHGFIPQMRMNNIAGDLKNSFVANSFQNYNSNWQRSVQFNDSVRMNNFSQNNNNIIQGVSYIGQSNYYPSQPIQQNPANLRKTTFAQNNDSNFEAGPQMTRSPSQPKINNNGFINMNNFQPNMNLNLIRQQTQGNVFQSQREQVHDGMINDPFQRKQIPYQANMSMNENQMNRLHSISFDKQVKPLNQQHIDLFDRTETSKDLLFANIFRQDGVASNNNLICSQSLFCYNFDDDYYDDNGWQRNKGGKLMDIRNVPRTPVKDKKIGFGFTNDDYDFSQFDEDNTTTKNSEPKNYYKEYLSVKDNFGANNIFGKRRNSLDEDREKLQPQQLQFNSPFKTAINIEEEGKTQAAAKRSKSRSQQRQLTQMKEALGASYHRD